MLRFSTAPFAILLATWLTDLIGAQWTVGVGGAIMIGAMVLIGLRNVQLWSE
jgi:hypothetical protein